MNRRRVIGISTVATLGTCLLAGSAAGEEKSLKEQLLGTWNLVSHESVLPDGTKFPVVISSRCRMRKDWLSALLPTRRAKWVKTGTGLRLFNFYCA